MLVFWIGGCLWEVVAYERWSHMEVRLYFKSMIYQISKFIKRITNSCGDDPKNFKYRFITIYMQLFKTKETDF